VPIALLGLFSSLLELGAMTSIVPLGILAGGNKIAPEFLLAPSADAVACQPMPNFM